MEIGRIGRKIAEHFPQLELTKRQNQTYKYWDIFFDGVQDGALFDWILRPELANALEQSGLSSLPDTTTVQTGGIESIQIADHLPNQLFGLERHLQEFLRDNWNVTSLGQEWELYRDEEGSQSGFEYPTDIGRIDLLARHKKAREWLIIELKRDQTADATVGQALRYMGWVKENLADPEEVVRGLIISHKADDKLYYALSVTPIVSLQLYEVEFRLKESEKPARRG